MVDAIMRFGQNRQPSRAKTVLLDAKPVCISPVLETLGKTQTDAYLHAGDQDRLA
jgi:hypothetical protein